jgi:hypothetical protein
MAEAIISDGPSRTKRPRAATKEETRQTSKKELRIIHMLDGDEGNLWQVRRAKTPKLERKIFM